jgi:hypothetical protein
MGIIDEIQKDGWIRNHSIPCVNEHLEENTVQTIINPQITKLQNDGAKDDEFIEQISESLQEHRDVDDISKIIQCITQKMIHDFEDGDILMNKPFLSIAAFTVFGKSILLQGKAAGYIS